MNRYSFSIKEDNINKFYNLLTYLILNASIKKLETLEYVWITINIILCIHFDERKQREGEKLF